MSGNTPDLFTTKDFDLTSQLSSQGTLTELAQLSSSITNDSSIPELAANTVVSETTALIDTDAGLFDSIAKLGSDIKDSFVALGDNVQYGFAALAGVLGSLTVSELRLGADASYLVSNTTQALGQAFESAAVLAEDNPYVSAAVTVTQGAFLTYAGYKAAPHAITFAKDQYNRAHSYATDTFAHLKGKWAEYRKSPSVTPAEQAPVNAETPENSSSPSTSL